MTDEIVLQMTFTLIALYTLVYYYDTLFRRRKRIIWITSISLYIIIQVLMRQLGVRNPYINLFVNVLVVLAFALFSYRGSKIKVLLSGSLYCVLWLISEIMLMFFLMMLNLQYASFELVGSFVSKLMLLVLVKIFHIYLSKDTYSGIPQKYKAFVLLFPLSSIVIIICIFYIADQHYSSQMAIISSIACAILLVTNLFALKLYDKIVAEMVLKNLNSRYFTQLQLCEEQIMEREETMLSIRTMRHDLRNHLVLLREMIVHAKKEKVEEYIDSLIIETVNKKQAAANTGNVVIDSLVNFKHGKAMKEGIDVKFNLVVPYNLPCEDADICIILGNILDNAIEAAVQVEPKQRYIDLNITARKNSLAIILKNSYGHSIQTSFEGIIVTTKPNKQRHGYGLFSVQQITDKYNGTMNIEYTDTEFKVTIILFIAYD